MQQINNYIKVFFELIISYLISRDLVWQLLNKSAIKSHQKSKPELTNFEKSIVNDIRNIGFATLNLDYFDKKVLNNLNLYKKQLNPLNSKTKSFLLYFLGGMYGSSRQMFNETNPLLELAAHSKLVNIVNSYFKMLSRLTYLEINETIVSKFAKSQMSQKFHKDPGIKQCIKVFIYLNDVDLENGPFTYVKSSHTLSNPSINQKRFGAGGVYPNEKDFNKIIDKQDITPICGKAGTVIIADTTGLHCGGNSKNQSREMATIVYYPPGDLKKSKICINIPNFENFYPNIKHLIPENQRK
jgi:hypothetical protein